MKFYEIILCGMTRWLLGQFLCNFCMHKQPSSPLPPWFISILKTSGSFYVFFPLPMITLLCFLSSSSHVYSSMFSFHFPCILLCFTLLCFLSSFHVYSCVFSWLYFYIYTFCSSFITTFWCTFHLPWKHIWILSHILKKIWSELYSLVLWWMLIFMLSL